jgi:hypothetical protein
MNLIPFLSFIPAFKFQEELLRTMMQVESVFFTMADSVKEDVLIICDRGAMDASACKHVTTLQPKQIFRSNFPFQLIFPVELVVKS